MAITTAPASRGTLLSTSNPKTAKGAAEGYLTAILHLAPYTLAGVGNVCSHATAGCIAGCLNLAGRGGIFARGETTNRIQEARIRRTREFTADRPAFLHRLAKEIEAHVRRAARAGLKPAVRLNGTSDLEWEGIAPDLFERFAAVQFYDYTKNPARARRFGAGQLPPNYHLTFSRSESTPVAKIERLLDAGVNVAAVYLEVPRFGWNPAAGIDSGLPVIDGDATDLRFLDPRGVIVGLRAKGPARRDTSGFVLEGEGAL